MGQLLKLGFIKATREKAVDKLLDINIEEKTKGSAAGNLARKKLDTLAVGLAGAASNVLPGVPFQAATAKALAPKEVSTRAAVDATTGSMMGTVLGGSYLTGAIVKEKGGIKPTVKSIETLLKPKSNPNKAKNINLLGKRVAKKLPKTSISGKAIEKTTKLPLEKIQRGLKSLGKYKSKLKGAAILTAIGSGVGSALGYERAIKRYQETKNV